MHEGNKNQLFNVKSYTQITCKHAEHRTEKNISTAQNQEEKCCSENRSIRKKNFFSCKIVNF